MNEFHMPWYCEQIEFVTLLCDHLQNGNTPLYWASENGHLETAKMLIEKGADVNAADKVSHVMIYE